MFEQRGAALLAALCFATVLAIALGSYLTLCYRTLALSTRSVQGTHAIELAEAGMEDALWSLNKNDWSTWTINGTTATKTLSGFGFESGVTGAVTLTITNYDGSAGSRAVTASGTTTTSDGTAISRTLTSSSSRAALFTNAVAATSGTVKFASGGSADSYDSSLGAYASQTPTYSAIIASGSTSTASATVQLTNAQIKGYVATLSTGPSYSSGAKLVGPTTPTGTAIDTSRISTSPYQPQFTEIVPTGVGTLISGGTTTIGTGATSPQLYYATDYSLVGGQTLTIDGPIILVVSGNFSMTGNTSKIRITTNGSLELHVAGNIVIDGKGIQNDTLKPQNFSLITSSSGTIEMGHDGTWTSPFHGVVYAPNGALTVNYNQTFYGALVGRSVLFNNSPVIHYDLNLRGLSFSGLETPYSVASVREM